MNLKSKYFSDDSKDFPWDKDALQTFKRRIEEKDIKCRMDDVFLLGFLRSRKFDQARSIELLENYYKRRCEYSYMFKDLLPSKLDHVLSLKCMHFLPNPDQDGRFIMIHKMAKWDVSVSNVLDFIRTMLMFIDFQLEFHRTQENKVVLITDASGLTLRHLLEFTPRNAYTIMTIIFRNSYQLRFAELHYVNVNVVIKAVLSFVLPLIAPKIRKRFHLHSEMSSLHEFVHPQYLPAELEGELPNFDATEMNEMLKENEEFYRMSESYLKIYEEGSKRKFKEGRFKYLDEDSLDTEFKSLLEDTEERFKRLEDDPEKFFASIDEEFEITRL